MKRLTYTLAAALTLVAAFAVAALPATGRGVEEAYYNGHVVRFQLPSSGSENTNDAVIGCYQAGPNLPGTSRPAPAKLYALFVPGVTQHSCPDGTQAHDHVLSAVPGTPDYTGAWTLIVVIPGPNFDVNDMPYTSVAAIAAGVSAGKLVLLDPGIELLAPVVEGS
jgi:hypothetical protein